MKLKILFIFVFYYTVNQVFAQFEHSFNYVKNNEIGINYAPYLFGEKGGNIFLKRKIDFDKKAENPKNYNYRVHFALWHKQEPFEVKYNSVLLDSFFYGKRRYLLGTIGLERTLIVKKASLFYGADIGLLYQTKANAKREIDYEDPSKTNVMKDRLFVTNTRDYGIPLNVFFGFRYAITQQLGLGVEFSATFVGAQREIKEYAYDQKNAALSTFTKLKENKIFFLNNNIPSILFLSWRF
jgi:hypothetical protein